MRYGSNLGLQFPSQIGAHRNSSRLPWSRPLVPLRNFPIENLNADGHRRQWKCVELLICSGLGKNWILTTLPELQERHPPCTFKKQARKHTRSTPRIGSIWVTIDHRKRVEESVQEGSYNATTTKNVGEAIYRTKSHHYSVAPLNVLLLLPRILQRYRTLFISWS